MQRINEGGFGLLGCWAYNDCPSASRYMYCAQHGSSLGSDLAVLHEKLVIFAAVEASNAQVQDYFIVHVPVWTTNGEGWWIRVRMLLGNCSVAPEGGILGAILGALDEDPLSPMSRLLEFYDFSHA